MRTALKSHCRTERPAGRTPSSPASAAPNGAGRARRPARRQQVIVDEQLRSSDADIFAADVANFHNAALTTPARGTRECSDQHGQACRTRNDRRRRALRCCRTYSDLFDLGYEAVGFDDRLDVVENWTVPYREGVVYYLDDGRVRGVLLWNVWGQVDAARG
jgi:hypothetical protein